VHTIHCHFCGGVVRDQATIQYRPPRASAQFALPENGLCTCTPPIVYEDSPLDDPPADDAADASTPVPRAPAPAPAPPAPSPPQVPPPAAGDPWKGAA